MYSSSFHAECKGENLCCGVEFNKPGLRCALSEQSHLIYVDKDGQRIRIRRLSQTWSIFTVDCPIRGAQTSIRTILQSKISNLTRH